jgi:hypothetical protein
MVIILFCYASMEIIAEPRTVIYILGRAMFAPGGFCSQEKMICSGRLGTSPYRLMRY